jgi:hypothetical protein
MLDFFYFILLNYNYIDYIKYNEIREVYILLLFSLKYSLKPKKHVLFF